MKQLIEAIDDDGNVYLVRPITIQWFLNGDRIGIPGLPPLIPTTLSIEDVAKIVLKEERNNEAW